MTFEELKKACEEKRIRAEKLYKHRAEEAILKDLREFSNKYSDRLKRSNDEYILDNSILVRISDGNIEIEDRRGTPFLWLFEIECEYSYMDTFLYKGIPESVRYVKDSKMEDSIKEVLARLEQTIRYMQNSQIEKYTYLSVKPYVELDNLEDVLKKVVEREPIEF